MPSKTEPTPSIDVPRVMIINPSKTQTAQTSSYASYTPHKADQETCVAPALSPEPGKNS